ncbi:hypothetical protein QUF84_00600 [Fictibacillus enclensis]|uniref:hypothetical protein n=1 Tax=Fictibacillus enclensis TaxID=1017270 RepID=UPI0025A0C0F9|nr:hypothetical protein [Fictibacillus enclensis]MDM5335796.1 hypothetical protein [Fictibacillus enclensis]
MKHFLKWKLLGFMVFLLAAAISFSIHVDAAVPKKVQVVTKDTIVSSDYSFIAQFNKKKTEVTTFGLKAKSLRSSTDSGYYYYSFTPLYNDSLKGKFGVKYTNIGTYLGKEVDLKITVLDWDYYLNNDTGKISFNQSDIACMTQGYNYVDLKWEFYEHGTNKLMQVQGFMTFNDIDSMQYMEISKETNDVIDSILVDSSSLDWLTFTSKNGNLRISEDKGLLSENDDLFAMFTMLINKTDTLHFKFEGNWRRLVPVRIECMIPPRVLESFSDFWPKSRPERKCYRHQKRLKLMVRKTRA